MFQDSYFEGVVIKLGKNFSKLSILNDEIIIAGSGVQDKKLSEFACENNLGGFEFLSCIPGTIGGGIRMNSGCYGEDISKILLSVQVMDFEGKLKVIYSSNINFSYRKCTSCKIIDD